MNEPAERTLPDGPTYVDDDGVEWLSMKEVRTRTGSPKTERQVRDRANEGKIRSLPRDSKLDRLYVAADDVDAFVESRGPVEEERAESEEPTVTVPLVIIERENALIEKVVEARLEQGRAEGVEQGLRDRVRELQIENEALRNQLFDRFSTAVGAAKVATAITSGTPEEDSPVRVLETSFRTEKPRPWWKIFGT